MSHTRKNYRRAAQQAGKRARSTERANNLDLARKLEDVAKDYIAGGHTASAERVLKDARRLRSFKVLPKYKSQ